MQNTEPQRRFFARMDAADQLMPLFDLLPGVSFFIKDRRGRFMKLNRRGCEYCGVRDEQDAIGKTDHDFFPAERADVYHADDLSVMTTGEAIRNRIENAPEDAGSPRLVMTTKWPLRDRRGRVIGVAGFSRQVETVRQQSHTADALARAIETLHRSFAEPLVTEDLATLVGLSTSQFERLFRSVTGTTVRQYLIRLRVDYASRLLEETDKTVSEIAQECGFYDHAHLSRCFRKQTGQTPSAWRHRLPPSG